MGSCGTSRKRVVQGEMCFFILTMGVAPRSRLTWAGLPRDRATETRTKNPREVILLCVAFDAPPNGMGTHPRKPLASSMHPHVQRCTRPRHSWTRRRLLRKHLL
jgi:hypothetical protein